MTTMRDAAIIIIEYLSRKGLIIDEATICMAMMDALDIDYRRMSGKSKAAIIYLVRRAMK